MISVHVKTDIGKRVSSNGVRLPEANGAGEIVLTKLAILNLVAQLTSLVTEPYLPPPKPEGT